MSSPARCLAKIGLLTSMLVSCVSPGGGGSGNGVGGGGGTGSSYAIKANVSNLIGTGLRLRLNDGEPVSVSGNGELTLGRLIGGATYSVAISAQPSGPAQTCSVARATGTVAAEDVSSISVACSSQGMSIAMVRVGDPGNPQQVATHQGAVTYEYYIGTFEVSNSEYATFLNAVAATDTYALYNEQMGWRDWGGITRSGSSGGYSYAPRAGHERKPVTLLSFWSMARFANWLTNGQPAGPQGPGTTETGVYAINGTLAPNNGTIARDGATWAAGGVALASDDEWYKAAYYQPAAAGGDADGYWSYPTRSNTAPAQASVSTAGELLSPDLGNSANYYPPGYYDGLNRAFVDGDALVNSAGYYGTFNQAGNVWELCDTVYRDGRVLRGGSASFQAAVFDSAGNYRGEGQKPQGSWDWGFRITSLRSLQ